MATRRLAQEYEQITNDGIEGVFITLPDDDNLFKWEAAIEGPEDTPFEGGTFNLDIQFPEQYPAKEPKLTFKTKIYHPNVGTDGNICFKGLNIDWNEKCSIRQVITQICSLLRFPNPDDALQPSIASEYKTFKSKFDDTARKWTHMYAKSE
jgi:ubiquitin-conjugating enzyme E2 D/E